MARTAQVKPSDFTGRERQKAAAAAADELAERKGQIATAQQIEIDRAESDVFDPVTQDSLGTVEAVQVDRKEREVIIKVIEDIDDMTFGAGTHYTFKAGQKYKVSEALAEHLDSIDLLIGRM